MLFIRAATASDVPLLLRFFRELAVRTATARGGRQGRDADQGRLCGKDKRLAMRCSLASIQPGRIPESFWRISLCGRRFAVEG